MRAETASRLVCLVSHCIDTSFRANYDGDKRKERLWTCIACYTAKLVFPLARRLDRDAMARQMAEECWWG